MNLLYSMSKPEHLHIIYAVPLAKITLYGPCLILKLNIQKLQCLRGNVCILKERRTEHQASGIRSVKI